MDTRGLPHPKPRPKADERVKKHQAEQLQIEHVRRLVARRDGTCRFPHCARWWEACDGPTTWAHLEPYRRARTRGQPPEQRHQTAGTLALCQQHHDLYDSHIYTISPIQVKRGANGPLRFWHPQEGLLGVS